LAKQGAAKSSAGAKRASAKPAQKKNPKKTRRRALLKTGELAERSGLSRQVIYTYTTMKLLQPVSTNKAGHKLFDEAALVHLKLIQDLVALGYTLRDVRQIFFKER
jgi:hypothetical protein